MSSGQACRPYRVSRSSIPERGCFRDLPGDEIVVFPPSPIVEPLENGKLRLGFAEDNKLALLNTFFAPLKMACLYVPKRQPQQGSSTFGLHPDKAGRLPTHPLR